MKLKDKELDKAVNNFTALMKERLAEKERATYTGWNDEQKISSAFLAIEIASDSLYMRDTLYPVKKISNFDICARLCIDIANRAMMLHYRLTK